MKKEAIELPIRSSLIGKKEEVVISFNEEVQTFWLDIVEGFKQACRQHDLYHQPVEFPNNKKLFGKKGGTNIPINTLGRWLFGVPGSVGNVQLRSLGETSFQVTWAKGLPDEVADLLRSVTANQVKNHCQFWGDEKYKNTWM
jgi:hypothetical protein